MTTRFSGIRLGPNQMNLERSLEVLDRYIELGGNFIDTADLYCHGESETFIGEWLTKTQKRADVILSTKVGHMVGPTQNDRGLSRRHIIEACDLSLKRLQTDYIDLYQTHIWDAATSLEETMRTLDDLVRCGKVRYVGVSNVCGWQLQKIVDMTRSMGLTPVVSLQQQYNLLSRHSEYEEFQVCKNEGLGILSWSPLKGGLLTGKYKRYEKPTASLGRIGVVAENEQMANPEVAPAWSKIDCEFYWTLRASLEQIGKEQGKTESQVALRWLLQKDIVTSVIIGCTSLKQLEENCGAASGWKLTKEQMELLDNISSIEKPYPYEMLDRVNAGRNNFFVPSPKIRNID